jgi:hypothetical protein
MGARAAAKYLEFHGVKDVDAGPEAGHE